MSSQGPTKRGRDPWDDFERLFADPFFSDVTRSFFGGPSAPMRPHATSSTARQIPIQGPSDSDDDQPPAGVLSIDELPNRHHSAATNAGDGGNEDAGYYADTAHDLPASQPDSIEEPLTSADTGPADDQGIGWDPSRGASDGGDEEGEEQQSAGVDSGKRRGGR